jgi:hypothetical protein
VKPAGTVRGARRTSLCEQKQRVALERERPFVFCYFDAYWIVSGADWLANNEPPEYTFTNTELTPAQVPGATGYDIEISFASPPLKLMIDDAIIVSSPQLDTADTVTVYLAFPVEQLVILLKTPTLIPGAAVGVLNWGVVAIAQPLAVPPLPPVGFPFCADSGADRSVKKTTATRTRFI